MVERDDSQEAGTLVDEKGGASSAHWDRFTVEDVLGKGGMATVYKGRDATTGTLLAIKVLNGNLDSSARVRFEREVKAAGRLRHENICGVLAFGEHEGQPFLAMELVEGDTLGQLARRAPPMPAVVVAALMAQLLDALGHAHAHGVLHRDLKPANVMVRPDGALKLVDFGIAKSTDDETVTKTGALVGTPAYMAPEQVRLEKVDHRADLFAAGMTMLAMMKRNLHRFAKKKSMDPTQMLVRVALEPTKPLLSEVPHAPVSLDNVLAGLTALDPALRFTDAAAARAVLNDTGLVPANPHAIVAQFVSDPEATARALDVALAREEARFSEEVARHEAGAPAAALALHRASLLDPTGGYSEKLAALCAQHSFTFERIVDDKIDALRADIYAEPQNAALVKRMSDMMKARGQIRMYAAYLWRYVRERPNDELALTQLRAVLDGPAEGERSSARLSTRSIIAGIKTGGFKAQPSTQQRKSGLAALAAASARPLSPVAADASQVRANEKRALATVVVAREVEQRSGSRNVVAIIVAGIVVAALALLVFGLKDAGAAIRGDKVPTDSSTIPQQLVDAEAKLAGAPREAEALATHVLEGHPTPDEGLLALWIRARAYQRTGRPDDARKDCDMYLAKVTDFHDPHLMDVKKLLSSLGSSQ